MQPSSAARITPTGTVRWHATAPIRARPRAGRTLLAGTVARATPPSACCRTVWLHGFLASSIRSKRWWPTPSRLRAVAPRPTRYAAMRSSSRAMRWVGRRVRLVHHVLTIVIGLLPELLSSVYRARWARCVPAASTVTALRSLRMIRRTGVLAALQGHRPVRVLFPTRFLGIRCRMSNRRTPSQAGVSSNPITPQALRRRPMTPVADQRMINDDELVRVNLADEELRKAVALSHLRHRAYRRRHYRLQLPYHRSLPRRYQDYLIYAARTTGVDAWKSWFTEAKGRHYKAACRRGGFSLLLPVRL